MRAPHLSGAAGPPQPRNLSFAPGTSRSARPARMVRASIPTVRPARLLSILIVLACAVLAHAQDLGVESPERPLHSAAAVQHLEAIRARTSDATRALKRVDERREALQATLDALDKDYDEYRDGYAEESVAGPPLDMADVRARMSALEQALSEDDNDAEETKRREERADVGRRLEDLRQRAITLDQRYQAWEEAARRQMTAEEWESQDALWDALETEHRAAIAALLVIGRDVATILDDCRTLTYQIRARRIATRVLLSRENLLLRGETAITVAAVSQGIQDLGRLPAWLRSTLSAVVGYVGDPANLPELAMVVALSLLVILGLLFVRRGLRRRLLPRAELTSDSQRSTNTLRALTSALLTALVAATPFVLLGTLVSGLSTGAAHVWIGVGVVTGSAIFLRALTRRLLPADGSWTPLELQEETAAFVRTGVRLLIIGTFAFVPAALALRGLGYENVGAIDVLWLIYELFVVLVVVLFLLRRPVLVEALSNASNERFRRLITSGTTVIRPILVIVGPILLALDLLEFNLLASFLLRLIGGVVGGALVAFLIYKLVWTAIAAWIRMLVQEPEGAPLDPEESHVEAALVIGRHLTRIAVFVVGIVVMLVIQRSNLDAAREFLDNDLPFQTTDEGRKITWWGVVVGSLVLLLFLTSVSKVKLALDRFVLPHTALEPALRYTICTLLGYAFTAFGLYFGLVQIVDLSAIGYIFAALSVGIGFGLQEIVSNFISGLILLFERPIKVGDVITVGTTEGIVQKINIRATRVQTHDNVSLLIPNKDFITQTVVNSVYSDTIIRQRIPVGVAYGSDTELVRTLLLEVGQSCRGRVSHRPAEAFFVEFGASSLDFELRVWLKDTMQRFQIASELRFAIDAAFRENGIEIPFSQHDLHLRSVDAEVAETLRGVQRLPPDDEEDDDEASA